jgi:hypothetical protein
VDVLTLTTKTIEEFGKGMASWHVLVVTKFCRMFCNLSPLQNFFFFFLTSFGLRCYLIMTDYYAIVSICTRHCVKEEFKDTKASGYQRHNNRLHITHRSHLMFFATMVQASLYNSPPA